MENKNIHLSVSQGESTDKPIIVHLLEGDAPNPVNYEPFSITGNINAVKDYLTTRTDIDKKGAHILMNEQKASITLIRFEGLPYKVTVIGSLTPYPELAQFGINTSKTHTLTDIRTLIKMNRIFFPDRDKHTALVNSLQNFTAKVEATHTNVADNRSNKSIGTTKQVETGLMADFELCIPLFNGGAHKSFRVEICYDVTDGGTKFWFESVELYELQKNMVIDTLKQQKEYFTDKGLTVISQ